MGHFYGTNLFLAESSATTGGLDSLLEPTGNIKRAQEMHRARVRRQARVLRHQRHVDLEQDRRPGDLQARRHRHRRSQLPQVASLRFRAGGRAAVLRRGVSADAVFDVRRACRCTTIKKALLDCQAQGTLDRVKAIDLTNCTFDGHMYNPARVMEECLAIKPDLIFLWDEAWFGFARFNAFHRRRTAMGAAATLTARYRDPAYRAQYRAVRPRPPADRRRQPARCSTRSCCPTPTRCASASTRPARRTSRCRRCGRAR